MLGGIYKFLQPWLFSMDGEQAHTLAITALKKGLGPSSPPSDDPILKSELWGRTFANPLGLAAGFDKNAEVMGPMLNLGFGFVEVGSITPRAQPGNPRPRLFRLVEDQAVINRMGFNNAGMDAAAAKLKAWRQGPNKAGLVGVNLGKNKTTEDAADDYRLGTQALAGYADYLVINVSSPNTPGLRALQGRDEVAALIAAVQDALPDPAPPLLLKIAPDLTPEDRQDIAAVALESGLDGLIISNTTIERPDSLMAVTKDEMGGLSGKPLFRPSTDLLREMYSLTDGKIPLVGVGGLSSGAEAYEKIRAGASLVQLYSALIYGGPGLVHKIKRDLADALRTDGHRSLQEAIGAEHRS
ncbi:quinone-dependent dihydroorotate dehydrogenase [Rhodovibrionaceae bacterium A322]